MPKLKHNNKATEPLARPWRKVICVCGCDHLEAFIVGKTLRFTVDMDKCTCPEGTQHTVLLAEGKTNE